MVEVQLRANGLTSVRAVDLSFVMRANSLKSREGFYMKHLSVSPFWKPGFFSLIDADHRILCTRIS